MSVGCNLVWVRQGTVQSRAGGRGGGGVQDTTHAKKDVITCPRVPPTSGGQKGCGAGGGLTSPEDVPHERPSPGPRATQLRMDCHW